MTNAMPADVTYTERTSRRQGPRLIEERSNRNDIDERSALVAEDTSENQTSVWTNNS